MSGVAEITKFLDEPKELLTYIGETGDFDAGFDSINWLVEVNKKVDGVLDIILPGMEEMWEKEPPKEYGGLSFYEATIKRTQLHPDTIKRHTRVGRMLEVAPESVRPAIEMMGFRSKIQIANKVEDGLELNEGQWKELADAYYPQDVTVKLHEIEGVSPRSQFCKFELDGENNLVAYTSQGRFVLYKLVEYDEPAVSEHTEWARGKLIRKLEARKR